MKQPLLTSYDLHDPRVTAFSTTRQGGYSQGPYGEFNINPYCGDDELSVSRNRALLCSHLGIADDRLLMPHQTHQTVVLDVDEPFLRLTPDERRERMEGVDALMTHVEDLCIGVSTADCIPLLLYDARHQAVSAVHAGWRGTVGRIARQAVRAMTSAYGSRPADLMAVVGPGISLESFEVGQEVYDAFLQAGFDMQPISRRYAKWHIDLPASNRLQLIDAGLRPDRIIMSGVCTYQHPDRYFSARRLGIRSGRIFTAIMLRPHG